MREVMRGVACLAAWAFLCLSPVATAQDTSSPSPVTGAVPDHIPLYIYTHTKPELSGVDALSIRFCDEIRTTNGFFGCAVPPRPLKIAGHKTENVKIDPPIPGEWRFSSDYELTFTPKQPWRAGTNYTVSFLADLFPSHVKLSDDGYDFKTQPLYLNEKSMDYLQDPSDPLKKLVSAKLTFNYPVDRALLQKALTFTMEGAPKPQPLAFSTAFDAQDTQANITVPVSALTKDAQFMNMVLAPTTKTADGSGKLTRKPPVNGKRIDNEWNERVLIPSLFDYLQISSVDAKVLKNSHYVPQQVLALDTNAAVDPKDLRQFAEIRLLPKDKPIPNLSPKKDYAWSSPDEVTPEVRATLPAVDFTTAQDAEPALINALNFSADGGRYLLVTVRKGMPALGGYQLGKDYETVVQVPTLPREIKVMAEGALLSLTGEKTLSVLTLGVSKLEYEIGRVKEEDLSHLISQTRGDFAHPQFRESYTFNEQNLTHIFREERQLESNDPKTPGYSSFDFSPYLKDGKGLFFLNIKSKPEPGQAEVTDRRFILLTDLGLIVKLNADGTRDVFVQSIANGGPVEDAQVEVLGINGEPVAQVRSDVDGHAQLPNLNAFTNEKKPVAFVARKGDDLSFLPFERHDRELNYSRFDVGGNRATEGMQAYMFTDRGIYRPGETAHIGMIVKAQDWSKTVDGLPLIFEVTNPRGQTVNKQVLHLTKEGLISADYVSNESGATGVYNAALYLGAGENKKGAELGNVPLRVEEFQPDRMKMTSTITQGDKSIQGLGWVKPKELAAGVTLMQLYGAPASARRVTAKLTLTPGGFGFDKYKEYNFAPEGSVTKSFDETLPETVTDAQGKAHFAFDLAKYGKSIYRLTFSGEGFEPDSGRSVKTSRSVLVSSLDYALGTKADGNFSYISPGDARTLSLIAVDPSLSKVAANDLTLEVKRAKDIQSLTKDEHGNYDYQVTTFETTISTDKFTVPAEGAQYKLVTDKPGSYVLVYKNGDGVILARVPYTVIGEGNASASFTREASMQVIPNKQAYGANEDISLNIQSPYTGTGLITIETDHVLAWRWFTASTNSTVQTIHIPEGFEGKGYINVQFTRDLKSKDIFMSPLSFAVVPFTANVDVRDQKVALSVPKDARPGDTITVDYHTKKPGKIVIYAVDEGILLYAHYQNPDPLDYFLMRRALEVRTSQIMDLLLPEYSLLKSLSMAGGDGFANDGKNLNPFKRKTLPPVAYWSGVIDSSSEDRHWTFTVPSYFNGGVRVLAVGVSQEAMGTAETAVSVHGPLMVTPNLPLFAAPGDTFTATATVANHAKGSGKDAKVTLELTPSEQLQIIDAPKAPLAIAEDSEQTVSIKLKATEALGGGSLRFTAKLGEEKFTIEETLSIRPPTPSFTTLLSGYTKEDATTIAQKRVLYPQLALVRAAVSSLPVSLIGGLRDYLVTYPYGCTEQMTSQNFPNVILYGNAELIKAFGWKPEAMETAIRQSFDQLRERQSAAGGWGMWNYYSEPHSFISTYVMHFLLEAKEKNLPVPEDVFSTGINYMKKIANEAPTSIEDAREKAYAIYVLTRAGETTANYIPHLIEYLDSDQSKVWHDDLVAVYLAVTYAQMQMQPEAEALLDNFHLEAPVYYTTDWHTYAFYDSLTKYSQYVYLIAKHFPKRLADMDKAVIWRVANYVGEGTYNTVSSSYAVMAIDAYVTAQKAALATVGITAKGVDGKELKLLVTGERMKVAELAAPAASIGFTSDTPGFFYQITNSGYDKTLPAKTLSAGLELERSYLGADGKPVKSVKLGDVITVKMKLRSGSNESIPNVAIVDLLPGGFELEPDAPAKATTDSGKQEADTDTAWQPGSVDKREDRAIFYGTFATEDETYSYRIKATSRGTFTLPPSYAESMYDPTLKARGVAGSIEVK